MSKDLISQALDLYEDLTNPELRGLAGTMALTKLKRVLKKIGSPLPDALAKITNERLKEFRQSNLIASADIALQKLQQPDRDIEKRIAQLDHIHHYINKAECGWQAIGLSEQKFIALKFSLLCEQMTTEETDIHLLEHRDNNILSFVRAMYKDDRISKEQYGAYLDQMVDTRISAHENLSKRSVAAIQSHFTRLEEETIPARDKLKLLSKTRELSRNIEHMGKDRTVPIYDQINTWEEKLIKLEWRERYDQAIAAGKPAMIDELEQEMGYINQHWSYIDLDAQAVKKQYLALHFAQTTEFFNKAKEYHQNEDIKRAFSCMASVNVDLHHHDFSEIGHDTQEMADFYKEILKIKVKQDFDKAMSSDEPTMEKLYAIEDIENLLNSNKVTWDDMAPYLDAQSVYPQINPIFIQAAQEQWEKYQGNQNHICIMNTVNLLNKAKIGWDALHTTHTEAAATAAENRHSLPALECK